MRVLVAGWFLLILAESHSESGFNIGCCCHSGTIKAVSMRGLALVAVLLLVLERGHNWRQKATSSLTAVRLGMTGEKSPFHQLPA